MTRGRKRRSSQADLDAAVEAVVAGASYDAAAKATGVPTSTIRDNVVARGVERRCVPRRGRRRVAEADVVVALKAIAAGASQVQAAAKA